MTSFTIQDISTIRNKGYHAEQNLTFALTGKIRKPDNKRFDIASDIPEYGISVKSSRFTLASAKAIAGNDFDSIWKEYKQRVHSSTFCYVTADCTVYSMDINEFEKFVYAFCRLERESTKNGGGLKIKCRHESAKMLEWLAAQI